MGVSGTQIAMNASDIVLLDDNFASIVQAIRWGRNVLATIRKFLQFQLGINMVAVIVTFLGSVISGSSPLSTVQLLWINLIMDSFGAIALASDDPDPNILNESPQKRSDPMLNRGMKQYIAIQTVYQAILLMVLLLHGDVLLPPDVLFTGAEGISGFPSMRIKTIIFNTFIMVQLPNLVCARSIRGELNFFAGFFKNKYFLIILFIIAAIQVFAVSVAYTLFNCVQLSLIEWGYCLIFSVVNIPFVFFCRVLFSLADALFKKSDNGKVAQEPRRPPAIKSIEALDIDTRATERKPSLPEILRGKIRTEMPMPTKSKSITSLKSFHSRININN
jgi:Ca2+-transporting ATPase